MKALIFDRVTDVITGNGVVIHLPGLFEEAEKNLRKGKGLCLSVWALVLYI